MWSREKLSSKDKADGRRSNVQETLYHNVLREMVSDDIAHLRYERYKSEAEIEECLRQFRRWITFASQELELVLVGKVKPEWEEVFPSIIQNILNIFKGLETPASRLAFLKKSKPFIEPIVRDFGEGGHCVDLPVAQTLTRFLQHNKVGREHCIASSDRWKTGCDWKREAPIIADVMDGNNSRFHPELMRPAAACEAHDLRIAIGFYDDGIEVGNTLL